MRKRPKFIAVLAWVNRERKAMGRKPIAAIPRGRHGRISKSCPLARALGPGCAVGIRKYNRPTGESHPMSPVAIAFVSRFDNGHYPWLEANDA